jgi:hypothetical protein
MNPSEVGNVVLSLPRPIIPPIFLNAAGVVGDMGGAVSSSMYSILIVLFRAMVDNGSEGEAYDPRGGEVSQRSSMSAFELKLLLLLVVLNGSAAAGIGGGTPKASETLKPEWSNVT